MLTHMRPMRRPGTWISWRVQTWAHLWPTPLPEAKKQKHLGDRTWIRSETLLIYRGATRLVEQYIYGPRELGLIRSRRRVICVWKA